MARKIKIAGNKAQALDDVVIAELHRQLRSELSRTQLSRTQLIISCVKPLHEPQPV